MMPMQLNCNGGTVCRYSTRVVAPASRIAFWNELSSRLLHGPLRIDSRSRAVFQGEISRFELPDCELFSIRSSAMSLVREAVAVSPPDEFVGLMVLCDGHGRIRIAGQDSAFAPGDIVLTDSAARTSCCFDEPVHVLFLILSASRFLGRRRQIKTLTNRCIRAESGALALLSRFLRDLLSAVQDETIGRRADAVSGAIWSLIDLAFPGDEGPARRVGLRRRAPLAAAQKLIERELCNSHLEVKDVAAALHISPRYMQLLFSEIGTTPTRFVLERRLQLAASRLRSNPELGIGDLALQVGFNDAAYFSRAFRGRFQVSAREYRARLARRAVSRSRP